MTPYSKIRQAVLCFLLLSLVPALAGAYDLSPTMNVWAGYTTLNMSGLNHVVDGLNSQAAALSLSHSDSSLNSGAMAGVDALYSVSASWNLGLSLGFIYPLGDAGIDSQNSDGSYAVKVHYWAGLIPLEVGGTYLLAQHGKFTFKGEAWLGWGIATGGESYSISNGGDAFSYYVPMHGGAPMTELRLSANYPISPRMSLIAKGGYRYCDVSSMSSNQDTNTGNGIQSTGAVVSYNGSPIDFDFSGFSLSGGVVLNF